MAESFLAQIIADGRVTIPEKIRILFDLKEGDLVRVTVERPNKNKGKERGA